MRGAPPWRRRHSGTHPSSVSALRADPPPGRATGLARPSDPTRGEGRTPHQSPSGSISLPVRWIWALYLMRRTVSRAEPSSL
ncbi:hypothetical protein EN784_44155 [bacterium M00.F.Ca.ET.141.01.1.1]|nr:hypothetical protein EN784_44155 [bacterium M00.F.Ca.ET.141.01.1.1]